MDRRIADVAEAHALASIRLKHQIGLRFRALAALGRNPALPIKPAQDPLSAKGRNRTSVVPARLLGSVGRLI